MHKFPFLEFSPEVATLASAGKLPEALITEAGLSINPIRQNDTDVDDIARRLYGMLPRLRITEPLCKTGPAVDLGEQFGDPEIARTADFYGPTCATSIVKLLVIDRLAAGKKACWLGSTRTKHSFTADR